MAVAMIVGFAGNTANAQETYQVSADGDCDLPVTTGNIYPSYTDISWTFKFVREGTGTMTYGIYFQITGGNVLNYYYAGSYPEGSYTFTGTSTSTATTNIITIGRTGTCRDIYSAISATVVYSD